MAPEPRRTVPGGCRVHVDITVVIVPVSDGIVRPDRRDGERVGAHEGRDVEMPAAGAAPILGAAPHMTVSRTNRNAPAGCRPRGGDHHLVTQAGQCRIDFVILESGKESGLGTSIFWLSGPLAGVKDDGSDGGQHEGQGKRRLVHHGTVCDGFSVVG